MTAQHQAPEVTSEPDLSWIDIAVCRNATVIADFSPGWREFFGSTDFHIEDCVDTGMSMPTEVGLYRWSGYHIRYWDDGDLANLDGGTFTRATQPLSLTVDEEWLRACLYELLYEHDPSCGHLDITHTAEKIAPLLLDRLQSLSLPVAGEQIAENANCSGDIDRSGLAQEVES